MKKLVTTFFAAALVASTSVWADDDHGRGHGKHGNKHAEKQWKKEQKHRAKHGHWQEERVVVHQYYDYAPPPPVVERHYHYTAPRVYSPPPGVHVVLPGIFLPF